MLRSSVATSQDQKRKKCKLIKGKIDFLQPVSLTFECSSEKFLIVLVLSVDRNVTCMVKDGSGSCRSCAMETRLGRLNHSFYGHLRNHPTHTSVQQNLGCDGVFEETVFDLNQE